MAPLYGTFVLQRLFVLAQPEQNVESKTEIQTFVLYLANPIAGQSPGGFTRTESVCVGDEETAGTSEFLFYELHALHAYLSANSTTYFDSLDLPIL